MDEIKGYWKGSEKLTKTDMLTFIFLKVETISELKVVL